MNRYEVLEKWGPEWRKYLEKKEFREKFAVWLGQEGKLEEFQSDAKEFFIGIH